ncbi:hypothetical protein [Campylobacter concisus]|uniref:hypothetical protein n=1 Tax=Campylobacter concisus TaxID=199 RepID=UPI000CD8FE2E|nr:hypothetical protein [Campylobacter concisus]
MPWGRLTTAYGRVSEFPEIFKRLWAAIGEKNLTQSVATGKSNSRQNKANPANNNEVKFSVKATCNVLYKIFSKTKSQIRFAKLCPRRKNSELFVKAF